MGTTTTERGWMLRETGGAPNWFIALGIAGILFFIGLAAYGYNTNHAAKASQPAARSSPTPSATMTEAPPTVLFIGDSYSAGAGASSGGARWTSLASRELGWAETNKALGGTGYLATSGVAGCGLDYCAAYSEAINSLTDVSPDIVVISGGRNDGPRDDYEAVVSSTIASAQALWPEAQIVVTSPLWDDDAAPAWLASNATQMRDAATAAGATYLDLGQPLAGQVGSVAADGVHPSDTGYAAIAVAFVAAWNAAATA